MALATQLPERDHKETRALYLLRFATQVFRTPPPLPRQIAEFLERLEDWPHSSAERSITSRSVLKLNADNINLERVSRRRPCSRWLLQGPNLQELFPTTTLGPVLLELRTV